MLTIDQVLIPLSGFVAYCGFWPLLSVFIDYLMASKRPPWLIVLGAAGALTGMVSMFVYYEWGIYSAVIVDGLIAGWVGTAAGLLYAVLRPRRYPNAVATSSASILE